MRSKERPEFRERVLWRHRSGDGYKESAVLKDPNIHSGPHNSQREQQGLFVELAIQPNWAVEKGVCKRGDQESNSCSVMSTRNPVWKWEKTSLQQSGLRDRIGQMEVKDRWKSDWSLQKATKGLWLWKNWLSGLMKHGWSVCLNFRHQVYRLKGTIHKPKYKVKSSLGTNLWMSLSSLAIALNWTQSIISGVLKMALYC